MFLTVFLSGAVLNTTFFGVNGVGREVESISAASVSVNGAGSCELVGAHEDGAFFGI